MANLRDILAGNLRENRRKGGFSQAKLAEKAGISTQYIAMIELSRQFPSPEILERIAAALGIEAHDLFAVPPSPESSLEKLRKDIIREIRDIIVETLEKKGNRDQGPGTGENGEYGEKTSRRSAEAQR